MKQGSDRTWGSYNVLIEFDGQDRVKTFRVVRDSQLIGALSAWVAQNQDSPLDLSTPLWLVAEAYATNLEYLVLGKDDVEFRGKGLDFKVARTDIQGFSVVGPAEHPAYLIRFRRKIKDSHIITFSVNTTTLLTLVRYLRQTGSARFLATMGQ